MKCDKKDMLLYAVTDRAWLKGQTLAQQVEACLEGGVTFVQLREKELENAEFLELAVELKKQCRKYNVPFVINDNVEVALACDADGIHVGQSDMEAGSARARLGENKILGVSVQTVEQAISAERNGADYLGVGAVFSTSTKLDADTVSLEMLKDICAVVSIPVVAIGGIGAQNIMELSGIGINGVAVISAIFAQKDITEAATKLKELAATMVAGINFKKEKEREILL